MASRVAGKIKLQSVDELLGVPEIAGTQEIEIERIHAFPNHPFKVLDDEKMDTLVDSIRENGIPQSLLRVTCDVQISFHNFRSDQVLQLLDSGCHFP